MDRDITETNGSSGAERTEGQSVGFMSAALTARFAYAAAAAGIAIVALVFFAAFFLPKSNASVDNRAVVLQGRNRDYIEAKNNYTRAADEISELTEKLGEKRQKLEDMSNEETSLEKLKKENSELTEKNEALKSDVTAKQARLDSINSGASPTLTLREGTFTVGKHISAGIYTVNGSGSIVVSYNGKTRVNKALSLSGETYTLAEGETIRIKGTARFAPAD